MPRIVIRDVEPNYHMGNAIIQAGQQLQEGISASARNKSQGPDEDEIVRKELVEKKLQEQASQETRAAMDQNLKEAMQSPGGVLGPYGILSQGRLKSLGEQGDKIKSQLATDKELARRMAPGTAEKYLSGRQAEYKQALLERGYEEEFKEVNRGLSSGVFDDPRSIYLGADSKGSGEPSEKAIQEAEMFNQDLQESLKAGKPPGQISKRIMERFDAHRQIRQRAKGWKQADERADKLFGSMEEVFQAVEDPEARQAMTEKLAKARGEWARTEYVDHRVASDPSKDLATIQGFLFEQQALAGGGPEGMSRPPAQEARALRAEQPKLDPPAPSNWPFNQIPQDAAGGPPGAPGPQMAPEPSPAPGAPPAGAEAPQMDRQSQQLVAMVKDEAQGALRAGSREERVKRIGELRKRIARDLGLDVTDEKVKALVRQALQEAQGGSE